MPRSADARSISLGELLAIVRARLKAADILEPGREARYLIGALTEIEPVMFLAHPEMAVSLANRDCVMDGVAKRVAGMPVGRIVGQREFYGRVFELGPSILEPRADSEVLIDAALEIVHGNGLAEAPIRIVDVGTGSGCLLITLLAELRRATGIGVDISVEALDIANSNARRHGVTDRAVFVAGDALQRVDGEFDLLVSNPPYIRHDDLVGLDVEVRDHDPLPALDGGLDGMDIYRRISYDVVRNVPDGWMLFEVGAGMAGAVCHEIDQFGMDGVRRDWRVWHDLNGHTRCVAAKTLND